MNIQLTMIHIFVLLLAAAGMSINVYMLLRLSDHLRLLAGINAIGCLGIVWIFARTIMGLPMSFHQYEQLVISGTLFVNTVILYFHTKKNGVRSDEK